MGRYGGWGAADAVFAPGASGNDLRDRERLRAVLARLGGSEDAGERLLRSAALTVLNAHYTDPMLVTAIYQALAGLGLEQGTVVEAGAGSGQFAAFAPAGIRITGVELDTATALIAQLLHPDAEILTGSVSDARFARVRDQSAAPVRVPRDSADGFAGNVPFSDVKWPDEVLNPGTRFSLHDHAIRWGVTRVAPGGLCAFITSRYTADAVNPRFRRTLAGELDLIGMVRLPSAAHKRMAGTAVVTDIIIGRRIADGERPLTSPETWEQSRPLPIAGSSQTARVNTYFHDNPQHILGTLQPGGMHGDGDFTVAPSGDLEQQLGAALGEITGRALAAGQRHEPRPAARPVIEILSRRPDGTITAKPDGTFTQVVHGQDVPLVISSGREAGQTRTLVALAEARAALISAEASCPEDTDEIDAMRSRMAQLYDAYTAVYGPIGRFTTRTVTYHVKTLEGVLDRLDFSRKDVPDPDVMLLEAYLGRDALTRIVRSAADPGRVRRSTRKDKHGETVTVATQLVETARVRAALMAALARLPQGADAEALTATFSERMSRIERGEQRTRLMPAAFRSDPRRPAVEALETFDPVTQTATKKPVFSRRTAMPHRMELGADTPQEALDLVLIHHRRVDLGQIARLLGTGEAEARAQLGTLVFDDPATGNLVAAGEYLSGNVREKLAAARTAADGDPERYRANVENLQAVQPPTLAAEDIQARLGSAWLSREIVQEGLRYLLEDPRLTVIHPGGSEWKVQSGTARNSRAQDTYGTSDWNALDLAEALLTNASITVRRTTIDPATGAEKSYRDDAATLFAFRKAQRLDADFVSWLWSDPSRADECVHLYNSAYNNQVKRVWDASPFYIPGLAPGMKLHPFQNAMVRRLHTESGMAAWVVGSGKTELGITAAMEGARLGRHRLTAIVTPASLVNQWRDRIYRTFPQASVLVADDDLRGRKDSRAVFTERAASGDYQMAITPYEFFGSLALSADAARASVDEEIDKLTRYAQEAAAQGDRYTAKDLQGKIAKLEAGYSAAVKASGGAAGFTDAGIDSVVVDEWHNFRRIRRDSNNRLLAMPGSGRANHMLAVFDYLRTHHPEGLRLGLTGTPLEQSIADAWAAMRFFTPGRLKALGLEEFDAFLTTFGRTEPRREPTPTGSGLHVRERQADWFNLPDMRRTLWDPFADVVRRADLGLNLPRLAGGRPQTHVLPQTPGQARMQADIDSRYEMFKAGDRDGDNHILKLMDQAGKNALHPRMLGMETDGKIKLEVWADHAAAWYHATKDRGFLDRDGNPHPVPGALRMVACELGVPDPARPNAWSVYSEMRALLAARGVPGDAIRFAQDADSDRKKAALWEDARTGRCNFVIGSAQTAGTGVDVPDRLQVLDYMTLSWNPTQFEQWLGRIVRQGNQNPEVAAHVWATEGTIEVLRADKISMKSAPFEALLDGTSETRRLTEEDDNPISAWAAEMTARMSGNPLLTAQRQAQLEVDTAQGIQDEWQRENGVKARRLAVMDKEIEELQADNAAIDTALSRAVDTRGDKFAARVGAGQYTVRAQAGAALIAALATTAAGDVSTLAGGNPQHLAELAGFAVTARYNRVTVIVPAQAADGQETLPDPGPAERTMITLGLEGVPHGQVGVIDAADLPGRDPAGLITSLEDRVRRLPGHKAKNTAAIGANRDQITKTRAELAQPSPYLQQLADARDALDRIEAQINEQITDDTPAPDAAQPGTDTRADTTGTDATDPPAASGPPGQGQEPAASATGPPAEPDTGQQPPGHAARATPAAAAAAGSHHPGPPDGAGKPGDGQGPPGPGLSREDLDFAYQHAYEYALGGSRDPSPEQEERAQDYAAWYLAAFRGEESLADLPGHGHAWAQFTERGYPARQPAATASSQDGQDQPATQATPEAASTPAPAGPQSPAAASTTAGPAATGPGGYYEARIASHPRASATWAASAEGRASAEAHARSHSARSDDVWEVRHVPGGPDATAAVIARYRLGCLQLDDDALQPATGQAAAPGPPRLPEGTQPLAGHTRWAGNLRPERLLYADGTPLTIHGQGDNNDQALPATAAGAIPAPPGSDYGPGRLQVIRWDDGRYETVHPALASPRSTGPYDGLSDRDRARWQAFDYAEAWPTTTAGLLPHLVDPGDVVEVERGPRSHTVDLREVRSVERGTGPSAAGFEIKIRRSKTTLYYPGNRLVPVRIPDAHPTLAAAIRSALPHKAGQPETASPAASQPAADTPGTAAPAGPAAGNPAQAPGPAAPDQPGHYSGRIRISLESGTPTVSGTSYDDPSELREALRANFEWRKKRQRWEYTGRSTGPVEAVKAIRDVLARLDQEPAAPAGKQFPPTPQQQAILGAFLDGKNIAVQALAGTGKTTTLVLLARTLMDRSPGKRIIYTAFNASIVADARGRFSRNVTAMTMHSLAKQQLLGTSYAAKITATGQGARWPEQWAEVLGIRAIATPGRDPVTAEAVARLVIATVKKFRESADGQPAHQHLPGHLAGSPQSPLAKAVVSYARKAWDDITGTGNAALLATGQALRVDHDDYLKVWALCRPRIDADVICFDEAQDVNALMRQVIVDQPAQTVVVGDSHQSIYGFRGAIDALKDWPADIVLPLTQSWRFGPAAAEFGNLFLASLGSGYLLEGNPALHTQIGCADDPDAILVRTNATAVAEVFAGLDAGKRTALAGGGQSIKDIAKAARDLQAGRGTKHPDLSRFSDWDEVRAYADQDEDGKSLQVFVRLVERHGPDGLIDMISRLTPEDDPTNPPQLTISTVHKAKGREWNSVRIAGDFRGPVTDPATGETTWPSPEERRLAYVAATRARELLETGSLSWIHDYPTASAADTPAEAPSQAPREAAPSPGPRPAATPHPPPAPGSKATGPHPQSDATACTPEHAEDPPARPGPEAADQDATADDARAAQVVAGARERAHEREQAHVPIDYERAKALIRRQRAALTRAIHSGEPARVVLAVQKAVSEWDQPGIAWPDDWSRWQRALDDALPGQFIRLQDLPDWPGPDTSAARGDTQLAGEPPQPAKAGPAAQAGSQPATRTAPTPGEPTGSSTPQPGPLTNSDLADELRCLPGFARWLSQAGRPDTATGLDSQRPGAGSSAVCDANGIQIAISGPGFTRRGLVTWSQAAGWIDTGITPARLGIAVIADRLATFCRTHRAQLIAASICDPDATATELGQIRDNATALIVDAALRRRGAAAPVPPAPGGDPAWYTAVMITRPGRGAGKAENVALERLTQLRAMIGEPQPATAAETRATIRRWIGSRLPDLVRALDNPAAVRAWIRGQAARRDPGSYDSSGERWYGTCPDGLITDRNGDHRAPALIRWEEIPAWIQPGITSSQRRRLLAAAGASSALLRRPLTAALHPNAGLTGPAEEEIKQAAQWRSEALNDAWTAIEAAPPPSPADLDHARDIYRDASPTQHTLFDEPVQDGTQTKNTTPAAVSRPPQPAPPGPPAPAGPGHPAGKAAEPARRQDPPGHPAAGTGHSPAPERTVPAGQHSPGAGHGDQRTSPQGQPSHQPSSAAPPRTSGTPGQNRGTAAGSATAGPAQDDPRPSRTPATNSDLAIALHHLSGQELTRFLTSGKPPGSHGSRTSRRKGLPDAGAHQEVDFERSGIRIAVLSRTAHRHGQISWRQVASWIDTGLTPARLGIIIGASRLHTYTYARRDELTAAGRDNTDATIRELDRISNETIDAALTAALSAHDAGAPVPPPSPGRPAYRTVAMLTHPDPSATPAENAILARIAELRRQLITEPQPSPTPGPQPAPAAQPQPQPAAPDGTIPAPAAAITTPTEAQPPRSARAAAAVTSRLSSDHLPSRKAVRDRPVADLMPPTAHDIFLALSRLPVTVLADLIGSGQPAGSSHLTAYSGTRADTEPDAGSRETVTPTPEGLRIQISAGNGSRGGQLSWADVAGWLRPGLSADRQQIMVQATQTRLRFADAYACFRGAGEGTLAVEAERELRSMGAAAAAAMLEAALAAHSGQPHPTGSLAQAAGDERGALHRITQLAAALPAQLPRPRTPVSQVKPGDIVCHPGYRLTPCRVSAPPRHHEDGVEISGRLTDPADGEPAGDITFIVPKTGDQEPVVLLMPAPARSLRSLTQATSTPPARDGAAATTDPTPATTLTQEDTMPPRKAPSRPEPAAQPAPAAPAADPAAADTPAAASGQPASTSRTGGARSGTRRAGTGSRRPGRAAPPKSGGDLQLAQQLDELTAVITQRKNAPPRQAGGQDDAAAIKAAFTRLRAALGDDALASTSPASAEPDPAPPARAPSPPAGDGHGAAPEFGDIRAAFADLRNVLGLPPQDAVSPDTGQHARPADPAASPGLDVAAAEAQACARWYRDAPEWQRITRIGQATRELIRAIREAAGDYWAEIHNDIRVRGFARTLAARVSFAVSGAAYILAGGLQRAGRADTRAWRAAWGLHRATATFADRVMRYSPPPGQPSSRMTDVREIIGHLAGRPGTAAHPGASHQPHAGPSAVRLANACFPRAAQPARHPSTAGARRAAAPHAARPRPAHRP
jgi:N12 class adenine-specific DNA methylase